MQNGEYERRAPIPNRLVDVYPYRHTRTGAIEFLLFRRAEGVVYAGQWRMVGGKIEPGETAWQAAQRELREETGQVPVLLWTVPSVNVFYEWSSDQVNLIPVFAAELTGDPVLDDEHEAFRWCYPEQAARRLAWPEQQRLVRLITRLLRRGGPAVDWIVTDS